MTKIHIIVFLVPLLGMLYSWFYISIRFHQRMIDREKLQQATKYKPKVRFGYFEDGR